MRTKPPDVAGLRYRDLDDFWDLIPFLAAKSSIVGSRNLPGPLAISFQVQMGSFGGLFPFKPSLRCQLLTAHYVEKCRRAAEMSLTGIAAGAAAPIGSQLVDASYVWGFETS